MDIPENSGDDFKIVLRQPIQSFTDAKNQTTPMMDSPLDVVCIFRWNGKYADMKYKEYVLVGISK